MKCPTVLVVDPEISMRVKIVYLIGDPRKFWKGSEEVKQRRKPIQSVFRRLHCGLLGLNPDGDLGRQCRSCMPQSCPPGRQGSWAIDLPSPGHHGLRAAPESIVSPAFSACPMCSQQTHSGCTSWAQQEAIGICRMVSTNGDVEGAPEVTATSIPGVQQDVNTQCTLHK